VHEPRDARQEFDVLPTRGSWSEHQKRDLNRRSIERDVVGYVAYDPACEAHFRHEIGSAVRNGESPAHRRAHLGLARVDSVIDAAEGTIVGIADGQTNEFAQEVRFGVAAERNADAIR
jgi:hypothetical protein